MYAIRHMQKGVVLTGAKHWDNEMKKKVQSQNFDSSSIDWELGKINSDGKFVSAENSSRIE